MVQRIQDEYSSDQLQVILLSTDDSKDLYDARAPKLFAKYGGGDWPSVILPNGFDDAIALGDFGYGALVVDELGIVRSAGEHDIQNVIKKVFVDRPSSNSKRQKN